MLKPFFQTLGEFETWSARAIHVSDRLASRNHCSDALQGPGVWYPTGSVLAITAHPNLWLPATQLKLKTFEYPSGETSIPYVYTMQGPAQGCDGETEYNAAWNKLRLLTKTFPCDRCDANLRCMSLIVDACGPVLARAVSRLPDDHSVLQQMFEAQLEMLKHCTLETQVVKRDGTGFVKKRQSDSDPFGGVSLFTGGLTSDDGNDNRKSFAALEIVGGKFVMSYMLEVHAHIVGYDVWKHQAATVLLQNRGFTNMQGTIALCASQGYFNVRSTAQLARKVVSELSKFTFVGKPGSPSWTRRVQEQIINCFHAWGREANKTTKVATKTVAKPSGPSLDFSNVSTDGSTFGAELLWRNGNDGARDEKNDNTFDLDLHTFYWQPGMSKPVQIYYAESNRHYCTKSLKFIPSVQREGPVDASQCPYGVETVISHVRDATHPVGGGTETMQFGSQVEGVIRFMVVNFANPRYGNVPTSVHFQLRIRVGNESLQSSRFRMLPHQSTGFNVDGVRMSKQACVTDIAPRLLQEMERVALLQTGAPADESMKRDTTDELQQVVLVNPEMVMKEMMTGAGIHLPLSATALNPNIRVMNSAEVAKARATVEENFGELSAQAMPADRLPGLVYDHRNLRPHESAFDAMKNLGLPLEMVRAMISGEPIYIPVLQRGVYPALPFRYTANKAGLARAHERHGHRRVSDH